MQQPLVLAIAIAIAAGGGLAGCNRDAPAQTAATAVAEAPVEDAAARAARLTTLYAEYWEEVLKLNPVQATFQGDARYNDQLPDFGSAEYREQVRSFNERWLKTIEAVGSEGLQGQDLLSYRIFVDERRNTLDGERFPDWMMPVNQMGSIVSYSVLLGSGTNAQPFATVEDYDAWLRRAARIPVLLDTEIANMRAGIDANVVQPRVVMEKVLPQFDTILVDDVEKSPFWGPVTKFPDGMSEADRERLTAAFRTLITDQLNPAIQRQRDFIANDYMPHTRDSVGLDALPDGMAWYTFSARQQTTSDLTPEAIHQIGLDEVARIHEQIRGVMAETKFEGSLQDFFRFMQTDRRFQFRSEEQLLAHYRAIEQKIEAKVPELFSLTPKAAFEIRPIEAFRAASAAGGEYMSPSEDGSRPGIFYVNTFDLPTRKRWDAEDLFLHEAIPGHHFQLALQQELTDLPAFRRFGGETAYIEGWGLYAESLGKELGLYSDPYDYFGRLQGELWRAVRLVVDTGLHSKGWTRQQVLDYMFENSSVSEPDAVAEAERYIAWPGQALAYKIGELKIQELRKRSEAALGEAFDIREFHAEVLKDGALPLPLLEAKIDAWIAERKGRVDAQPVTAAPADVES
ncbi:DUF885 family protein [Luteimonas fraxinea]|uniref:DUF885 family protein n=1 Tax=Luteimonas fraxinea TaxID=2901869 RepID=A0ABS8UIB0_9GAMM|nr:DUF885 family protein [Luteimonas fraxinea]MCD9098461.1 DUF885 family protein [Luteimonas fraxinea]UHH10572.1 DUF885 family protein [Luteimonas fraxinea]